MTTQNHKAALTVRNATARDIKGIIALLSRAYPTEPPYTRAQIKGQLSNFPEGQFIVEYEDDIVGYSASFLLDEATAMPPPPYMGRHHGWRLCGAA